MKPSTLPLLLASFALGYALGRRRTTRDLQGLVEQGRRDHLAIEREAERLEWGYVGDTGRNGR